MQVISPAEALGQWGLVATPRGKNSSLMWQPNSNQVLYISLSYYCEVLNHPAICLTQYSHQPNNLKMVMSW